MFWNFDIHDSCFVFRFIQREGIVCKKKKKKMNDLVYVIYNAKLKSKLTRKNIVLPFEDINSDDEWITEENVEEF